ncbi:MAG: ATP-binding protein [Planctomycetota bacterium]|nr:MAG: ATP-binding protein [Planctomycetota bacterium]
MVSSPTRSQLRFLRDAARLLNAGQTRSLILSGNVADLFPPPDGDGNDEWVPLPELLRRSWSVPGRLVITYEINGPLRFQSEAVQRRLRDAWVRWRTGLGPGDLALQRLASGQSPGDIDAGFDQLCAQAIGKPTLALELLRQFCCCSRLEHQGAPVLREDLLIIIEAADLILPEATISSLGDADRQRLHICHDWFADPEFNAAYDAVVLICESRAALNQRIARLPQMLEMTVDDPDLALREAYIAHEDIPELSPEDRTRLALGSAGLTIHALRQLLLGINHNHGTWSPALLIDKVEEHLLAQLGEDSISFSRPNHTLAQVMGFDRLKRFLAEELVPRLRHGGAAALSGAAVCGPIGAGKTFIFEAVAGELGLPVLELKNLRSQWFGQTDAIVERLRRLLTALDRVVIMVDEADTQFGDLGPGSHETERRLTGRLQSMMSDPKLLGKVFWLLMTARIDRLSADLRRPGRAGDLIIPVLDPSPEERQAFVLWTCEPVCLAPSHGLRKRLLAHTHDWSAAAYASLRRELQAQRNTLGKDLSEAEILALVEDRLLPPLAQVRRRQTLLALLNCTRRSLLPDPEVDEATRESWRRELAALEMTP